MQAGAAIIVVMGVTGAGKSTVARLLAAQLGWAMLEGDSLHPPANIQRMAAGIALTDEDRRGWLEAIAQRIAAAAAAGCGLVVTCSALKRRYRDVLRQADPAVIFVYLAGDRQLIERRLAARRDHFMPAMMLESQLQTLEPPAGDERVIRCDIAGEPAAIAAAVLAGLPLQAACGRRA